MKIYYLFLFIGIASFSQKHHFQVQKNNLFWQIEFKSDAPNVLELIDKNHPGVFTDKATDTGNAVNISFGLNYEDYTERTNFNFELTKTKNSYIIDCPQKVRHYLGVFLWKEKSNMIMHLNLNV
jgi:hypothetical protein